MLFFFLLPSHCSRPDQDTVYYSGTTLSNVDYHHGQLPPAIGVHNIQVMRANRENPEMADGFGWTYNHSPMLVYWNNRYYLEYLSDSIGEHVPPGHTLIVTSQDGYTWSKPRVVFPRYKIPDGTRKEGYEGIAKDLYAVMHQRMGFFVAENNRLLVSGYYGICMDKNDSPNDGKGIGRVVREVKSDGNYGLVYFIRYNKNWNAGNTSFPFYKECDDEGFINACEEILTNPLMMQQWNEEADRDDPLIPMTNQFKALSYYHLPDGRVVGLWKHALFAISVDGGETWPRPVRAPGIVNKNAKIWGQETTDNKYAIVYNPSEFRWPLAVSTSTDGLEYKDLLLVNGEISTMRYGGQHKNYGPQYVRGILEGNGIPTDNNMWVTYSMNKEDIWISRIPVPIVSEVEDHIDEDVNLLPDGEELDKWNVFSPLWAPVTIEKLNDEKCLSLKDFDPYDYARAERIFPSGKYLVAEFSVIASQNNHGLLHIEFQDASGNAAVRLIFDSDSLLKAKSGYQYSTIMKYKPNTQYDIKAVLNVSTRFYQLFVNEADMGTRMFFAPVNSLCRITFRTGEVRRFPDADSPAVQDFDVADPGIPVEKAVYYIKSLKTYEAR